MPITTSTPHRRTQPTLSPTSAGGRVILATAPAAEAIEAVVPGLGPGGRLLVVGVSHDSIALSPQDLVSRKRTVAGWYSGTGLDSEETLEFSALREVEPMVETYSLAAVSEA